MRFKERSHLHKKQGEMVSADIEAVASYRKDLVAVSHQIVFEFPQPHGL